MANEEISSINIESGNNQMTMIFKRENFDQCQTNGFTSISIETNGLEINIRRSNRDRLSQRSKSVCQRSIDYEKKPKSSQIYWDYSDLYGPNMWSRIFPQLKCKKYQSPVRIYTNQCEYEPMLTQYPFIFDIDEHCCQILENTGHSFQVSGKGYSYITGGPATLDEYRFLQFHMHWGTNDNEGSEHVIDGNRLPAELHIVTWNSSLYKTPQEAVTSERFGGLMVFAILIKIISNDNPKLEKFLNLFNEIIHKDEKINLELNTILLTDLIPDNNQDYYTYDGSLTTPMCHESVRWIVFREQIGFSRKQLNQLRQLKHTCKTDKLTNEYIEKNFRPLMPLNGRTIYRSFA